jgi:hypothetical protein
MLELVKVALRVTSSAYDAELNQLIAAALADLGLVDIMPDLLTASEADVLIKQAVMTYCAMHFGTPANYDRLKAAYDEQKAQLLMSSAYTEY